MVNRFRLNSGGCSCSRVDAGEDSSRDLTSISLLLKTMTQSFRIKTIQKLTDLCEAANLLKYRPIELRLIHARRNSSAQKEFSALLCHRLTLRWKSLALKRWATSRKRQSHLAPRMLDYIAMAPTSTRGDLDAQIWLVLRHWKSLS